MLTGTVRLLVLLLLSAGVGNGLAAIPQLREAGCADAQDAAPRAAGQEGPSVTSRRQLLPLGTRCTTNEAQSTETYAASPAGIVAWSFGVMALLLLATVGSSAAARGAALAACNFAAISYLGHDGHELNAIMMYVIVLGCPITVAVSWLLSGRTAAEWRSTLASALVVSLACAVALLAIYDIPQVTTGVALCVSALAASSTTGLMAGKTL